MRRHRRSLPMQTRRCGLPMQTRRRSRPMQRRHRSSRCSAATAAPDAAPPSRPPDAAPLPQLPKLRRHRGLLKHRRRLGRPMQLHRAAASPPVANARARSTQRRRPEVTQPAVEIWAAKAPELQTPTSTTAHVASTPPPSDHAAAPHDQRCALANRSSPRHHRRTKGRKDFNPTVGNAASKKKGGKTGVIVGVIVGVAVLGLTTLAGIFVWIQKRRKLSLEQEELYNIVGRPNVLSYSELRSATENFSSNNLLGQGGYGSVYKGKLTDGRFVAVKQLSEASHQGKKEFATEIETISRVQHRNLVKLYGCCLEGNKPLLVYEYLENGSLDRALFEKGCAYLDWPTRFEICLGIARGLAYLHEESSICVVHRDIKASNILLDANLNPKISDFGLAKLYDDKETHVSTKVAGTFGYLAPEYAMRGRMTEKVDVFAFGVVVLETLAGRPNYYTKDEDKVYIFEWVWELYEDNRPLDMLDPRLEEFNSEEVLRAIKVALMCTQGSAHQRPPMSRVVAMLMGDIETPDGVTKPSYITEWEIKGGGDTSYVISSVSGQSSSASRVCGSSQIISSVIY
ncbi:probable LRR receptor-like serine/threonine-protein kinase At1g56140 [Lolium rigidum]|uniref:probable LRR receptor-like serine/threonine-protein kinase At1g56140 n=1 Tax=Lolium rigidum TaxID=89674 RepID=UPI001F5CDBAC|nr:probable LRR receptor-like serine/threonine-protein kinase At1g56140 [Lolium rigidum]